MNTITVAQTRTLAKRLEHLDSYVTLGFRLLYRSGNVVVYYLSKEDIPLRLTIFPNGNWRLESRHTNGLIEKGEYGN